MNESLSNKVSNNKESYTKNLNHSIASTEIENATDIDNENIASSSKVDISHIYDFLGCRTSKAWLNQAIENLPIIIQDHLNCEKKAAGTAMNLIFRYEKHQDLQLKLTRLIREEMLHYRQVMNIMNERGQEWQHLSAGRYAKGMLKHKRTFEPQALIDVLIIGAYIEARSCERFEALSLVIDDKKLAKYYTYLLKSESRHYEDYLELAQSISDEDISDRVALFRQVEADLISGPDAHLRFHSGVPVAVT